MRTDVREVGEFAWRGDMATWVDIDDKPVSIAKAHDLDKQADALAQKNIMERLETARAAFHCMTSDQERTAAARWLIEAYSLKI